MPQKKIEISEEVLRDLYWNQGMSGKDIAELYGCDRATIRRYMIKYDIPRRSRKKVNLSKEDLHDLYWNQKMRSIEIAEMCSCDRSTVCKTMDKYDIPRRSSRKRINIHIDVLHDLYWNQGLTLDAIGDRLNCSTGTIYGNMVAYGISMRSKSETLKNREPMSREARERISKSLSGDKHPQWQGGISFEPYCTKFNKAFKESIREKFGRVCFLCPTTEEENGRKLCVHHVNYNKDCLCDNSDCEFVPLCNKCHTKTNFNRDCWENLIMDKLKEKKKSQQSLTGSHRYSAYQQQTLWQVR